MPHNTSRLEAVATIGIDAPRLARNAEAELAGLAALPNSAHGPMSASLIGHSGSSAFRLSTTTVSMSLTGSWGKTRNLSLDPSGTSSSASFCSGEAVAAPTKMLL